MGVIKFDDDKRRPFSVKNADWVYRANFCYHLQVEVDLPTRKLTCRDCQTVLDPYEWLERIAQREQRSEVNKRLLKEQMKMARVIEEIVLAGGRLVVSQQGAVVEIPHDGKKYSSRAKGSYYAEPQYRAMAWITSAKEWTDRKIHAFKHKAEREAQQRRERRREL